MKFASGEKVMEFLGNNCGSHVTLFNKKLVSKIKEDHWNEVLLQCTSQDMDDIQSGDEVGDVSMLDHVASDVFDLESPGKPKK